MSSGICSIEGCERRHYAKAICRLHYSRQRRTGTTDLLERPRVERVPCSVDGCETSSKNRGMCGMHAERRRSGGPVDGPKRNARGVPFEKLYRPTDTGCWQWQGSMSPDGYGRFSVGYAHRFSYEKAIGPIPDGFHIDHLCRNRGCVNPAHLEAVTPRTNILRGVAPSALAVQMGRCKRGHEFTADNTYVQPSTGHRRCRKCRALTRKSTEGRERRAA